MVDIIENCLSLLHYLNRRKRWIRQSYLDILYRAGYNTDRVYNSLLRAGLIEFREIQHYNRDFTECRLSPDGSDFINGIAGPSEGFKKLQYYLFARGIIKSFRCGFCGRYFLHHAGLAIHDKRRKENSKCPKIR
jgi:hypothetical protein